MKRTEKVRVSELWEIKGEGSENHTGEGVFLGSKRGNESISFLELSHLGSDLGGILLIGINQVGAEGAVGLPSLENLLGFVVVFISGPHCPSLLGGSLVVVGGSLSGVDLPSRGKQALNNRKVTILGGIP